MTSQSIITQQCKDNAWYSQPSNEIQAQFASAAAGFPAQDTQQRLITNGPDELENDNLVSPSQIFSGRFQSHIIWLLIVAGVVLALLGGSADVIAVVLINAIIVFFQEFNVEKTQHSTLEECRPRQHAATLNPLKDPGGAMCLIGQQSAE